MEEEGLREALCTLGNGYFATRGAAEEAQADEVHYPGTYLAGGYNRLTTEIAGRAVENEDLVNFPNWLYLTFRAEGEDWLNLRALEVLQYEQLLDMRSGVLERSARVKDRAGRVTRFRSRRFVHMDRVHLAGIELVIESENWSGVLEVRSGLDGRVINAGVERYKQLRCDHLEHLDECEVDGETILLHVRTNRSRIEMAQAARTRLFHGGSQQCERTLVTERGFLAHHLRCEAVQNRSVRIEKIVSVFTSKDRAIWEAADEAQAAVKAAPSFDELLRSHVRAWRHLWHRCDIVVKENSESAEKLMPWTTELILRLHIFHLLQTASLNTIELDVGVPARGWHGEAYRGHVFWDELFIFPFLNLRVPEITRSLLRYRYRRLNAAREMARRQGFMGALYPWQSGSNGREETQQVHLNPRSGRWLPDHTHLQRHVNAAIAYNVWQYVQATGDCEFLSFYGAEMVLEIARFWASSATYNEQLGRYEIKAVVGPDEYHEKYFDRETPGLDNNAYTNVMAAWTIHWALEALDSLEEERRLELRETLELRDEELDRWREISTRMRIVFHEHEGKTIISQFEGYEHLEELDWALYRARYANLHRLDRILEAEGDSANCYKASKQADVLMLFYLFSEHELKQTFERLGYEFDRELIPRNVDYYMQRTDHGSTLSRVVHSWVLARLDRPHGGELFHEALESDISDIQGGTTREGIHLGAMAGTVDLVQRCFTGLTIHDDVMWFEPRLPESMRQLKLRVRFRGNWMHVTIERDAMELEVAASANQAVRIGVDGCVHEIAPDEKKRFAHNRPHLPAHAG